MINVAKISNCDKGNGVRGQRSEVRGRADAPLTSDLLPHFLIFSGGKER